MSNKIFITILIITIKISMFAQTWHQVGSDIRGESKVDRSGYSISLNDNGNIIAIGAPNNKGNGSGMLGQWSFGHVRVYQKINGKWTQMGSDIDGEAPSDNFGHSVSLNGSGDILAVGAIGNDGNGNNAGHVRVFRYSNNNWLQIGSDIDGEAPNDESGNSISLSKDGNILAIGADLNNQRQGHVRVYENINDNWIQQSTDIDGTRTDDFFGCSVSLNGSGNLLAVGAIGSDLEGTSGRPGYKPSAGEVTLFRYIDGSWKQKYRIEGEKDYENFGKVISLSDDGDIIAILGNFDVRIYDKMTKIGTIVNSGTYRISLSGDGKSIAVGGNWHKGGVQPEYRAWVRVYNYINNNWTQLGSDIEWFNKDTNTITNVSMNSDGKTVAMGLPGVKYSGGTPNVDYNGTVKIHSICPEGPFYEKVISCNEFTWGNGITYTESNSLASDTFQTAFGCDSIVSLNLTIVKNKDLISKHPIDKVSYLTSDEKFKIETPSDLDVNYQWQIKKGSKFQDLTNFRQYSGTSTKELTISPVLLSDDNSIFRCIVNFGDCTDTSDVAVLKINRINISNINLSQRFQIYPNPTRDLLNIKVLPSDIGTFFSIKSVIGKELIRKKIDRTDNIFDLGKLPEGVYLLEIDGYLDLTKKIIKCN